MTTNLPITAASLTRLRPSLASKVQGFTIIEVLIAATIIAVTVGGALSALTSLNSVAQASRLRTGAQAVAQNHIDDAINRDWSRFIANPNNLPAPIRPGVHWVIPNMVDGNDNGLPAYYDTNDPAGVPFTYSNTEPVDDNVPIYEEDPNRTVDSLTVNALVRVEAIDATSAGAGYRLHEIRVNVTYEYRSREYDVQLRTLRTSN